MRAGWPERRLGVDRNNALLLLSNFFWGLGSGLYTAIWPVHLARLGAAPAQIGLALSITTAVSVVVYIPAAALAGRLGRKRTMLLGWSMGPASAGSPPGGRAAGPGQLERGFALYNTMLNLSLTLSTLLAGALFGLDPALPFAVAAGGVLAVPLVIRAAAPAARALRLVRRSRRITPA